MEPVARLDCDVQNPLETQAGDHFRMPACQGARIARSPTPSSVADTPNILKRRISDAKLANAGAPVAMSISGVSSQYRKVPKIIATGCCSVERLRVPPIDILFISQTPVSIVIPSCTQDFFERLSRPNVWIDRDVAIIELRTS